MKPNVALHRPDPAYLRSLIAAAGISQCQAARLLGLDPRTIRAYLADTGAKTSARAPYLVQYALEGLVNG